MSYAEYMQRDQRGSKGLPPRGSKGSTEIKGINGYQGSRGSHTGINQGLIFQRIWPEMGRRGSDRAETRGKRSHKVQDIF